MIVEREQGGKGRGLIVSMVWLKMLLLQSFFFFCRMANSKRLGCLFKVPVGWHRPTRQALENRWLTENQVLLPSLTISLWNKVPQCQTTAELNSEPRIQKKLFTRVFLSPTFWWPSAIFTDPISTIYSNWLSLSSNPQLPLSSEHWNCIWFSQVESFHWANAPQN